MVGAGRTPGGLGHEVLRHVVDGGFTGDVVAVNAQVAAGETVGGVPAYPRLSAVPHDVDLVVVAVPAEDVLAVVAEAARTELSGSSWCPPGSPRPTTTGRERQADLVRPRARLRDARRRPECTGAAEHCARVWLNASIAHRLPARGRAGFFCQSGALGGAILERAAARGLGVSTFVSAGNRADVSGNDLMQYWEDDPATDVVLLYLESIGNPRKFTRIARRLSRRKPVLAVRSGRSTQALPLGHRVRRTTLPPEALDALFEQSGVIQTRTLTELFDVGVLLTHQPLPDGAAVAVVTNSDALAVLAADAIEAAGLHVGGSPVALRGDASAQAFATAMAAAVEDPAVHVVLAVHLPSVGTDPTAHEALILDAARRGTTAVAAVLVAAAADRGLLSDGSVSVPVFGTVEEAVTAIAAVVRYAAWRRAPQSLPPELPGLRVAEADELLGRLVAGLPPAGTGAAELRLRAQEPGDELSTLLAAYGIGVRPSVVVTAASQAVQAARRLGYPVALTAIDPENERRVDGVGVRLDLYNDRAVRGAWRALSAELDPGQAVERSVQGMVGRGVDCRVGTVEDPSFGPVVALTVGGAVPQLLGDRTYRIPPLTDADAHALVTSPRVAPLLSRVPEAAREDLERLLVRVGRLAEESPEVAWLVLDPVLVTTDGPVVLSAQARVRRPGTRTDGDARRLLR